MTKAEKIRVTVDLSEGLNQRIQEVADETGRTKAEVMRRSLDLFLRANDAAKDDMTVGAWKEDREHNRRVEREFLGVRSD